MISALDAGRRVDQGVTSGHGVFMKFSQSVKAAAVVGVSLLGATLANAQVAATDGAAAVTSLVAGQAGYLTSMIALSLAAVGIMIAVKWVKRARGAA